MGSCSTESVDGLSRQIIDQARCIKPNEFVPLPKRANLVMAPNVYPYLELGARDHLLTRARRAQERDDDDQQRAPHRGSAVLGLALVAEQDLRRANGDAPGREQSRDRHRARHQRSRELATRARSPRFQMARRLGSRALRLQVRVAHARRHRCARVPKALEPKSQRRRDHREWPLRRCHRTALEKVSAEWLLTRGELRQGSRRADGTRASSSLRDHTASQRSNVAAWPCRCPASSSRFQTTACSMRKRRPDADTRTPA